MREDDDIHALRREVRRLRDVVGVDAAKLREAARAVILHEFSRMDDPNGPAGMEAALARAREHEHENWTPWPALAKLVT